MYFRNHFDASLVKEFGKFDVEKAGSCTYCQTSILKTLQYFKEPARPAGYYGSGVDTAAYHACELCGWWKAVFRENWYTSGSSGVNGSRVSGAIGALKTFADNDISVPAEEARNFLVARYERRNTLHPKVLEETVGSVYSAFGYDVEITAYQKDGGVDIILRASSGAQIGVQVKRTKNKIHVAQIRELAGALLVKGMPAGIFVTTSEFTREASDTAEKLLGRGLPIQLVDAHRFYSALKIAQRLRPLKISKDELLELRQHSALVSEYVYPHSL